MDAERELGMTVGLSEQEKIRQQFDAEPYPRIPLEGFPKDDFERFFQNSLVTPYYLHHHHVIDMQDRLILDAGCGSGYKAVVLAAANPGAKIIGVDLSEQSVKLARQRFEFHQLAGGEFHQLSLYDIKQLGLEFDYISCDETLYLLPDPVAGLEALKSVLKPKGILRANLHSKYQRARLYQAQELFKFMGLLDESPGEFEAEVVLETMNSLKPATQLKEETWQQMRISNLELEKMRELIATNFLLVGDKGYSILDLFDMLEQANLELISMVNWRQWEIMDLFKDADNLPAFWDLSLAEASLRDRLHVFELLHPVHRLLDFWCTHPDMDQAISVSDWSEADWRRVVAHLHPHLQNQILKESLLSAIERAKPFEISQQVKLPTNSPIVLEANLAACLLPLWESPQPIAVLVERYQRSNPVDPVTLEPIGTEAAFTTVKDLLRRLEIYLYVLLERS
ncbi:MAG: class I SAM-dependent methyltransferase [Pegethrix bostrychoides GSE-TBD4-15B]|jgi:2-polyprenyl-3-methyl-5-hydroxy-6-metoxy-1,4-benzoquinol methylase|uniref:Class I SAM-dependent methyltransferase n=1 Tax=Pegethrix bostrychoides GSE-TBD4-15B TaxID=2839662 RepID=A0A951P821_9CYAN|nr:class I SAM-dependent methyltransferase [Pegethrix bostrychoides GSE-TBD4-15B]